MTDDRTVEVYNAKAEDYNQMTQNSAEAQALTEFITAIPINGYVLDLGCGPGKSSALMREQGLRVDAVDASPAMVKLANNSFNLNARLGTFNDLESFDEYDGVWANFSLLHATATEFPQILRSIHAALKPDGLLHLGMKTGTGAKRDHLGRFYTYYSRDELDEHLNQVGFRIQAARTGTDPGLAGTNDPWVTLRSVKQ